VVRPLLIDVAPGSARLVPEGHIPPLRVTFWTEAQSRGAATFGVSFRWIRRDGEDRPLAISAPESSDQDTGEYGAVTSVREQLS
jgi:hypothetical protein